MGILVAECSPGSSSPIYQMLVMNPGFYCQHIENIIISLPGEPQGSILGGAFLISRDNLIPTNQSPPGNHSGHKGCPEDRVRFPHRETSGRSRSCRTYQEPPSEKHPEPPKSSPQCIRCAASGLCCGLFCAAPA